MPAGGRPRRGAGPEVVDAARHHGRLAAAEDVGGAGRRRVDEEAFDDRDEVVAGQGWPLRLR
jgi:hypothetical protein